MHFVETMDEVLKIALEDEIPVAEENADDKIEEYKPSHGEGFFSRFHNPLKISSAELVCSAPDPSRFPRDDLPEIAFIGRSNVGKSSLINSLLGRQGLARTSGTPGRTRLLNFFRINRRFYFVDCPGYGYAKVSKDLRLQWARLFDNYIQPKRETGCLCIDH